MSCNKCQYPVGDVVCSKSPSVSTCHKRCCNHSCGYIVAATQYFGSSACADVMNTYEIVAQGVTLNAMAPGAQLAIERGERIFLQFLENTMIVRMRIPDCETHSTWGDYMESEQGGKKMQEIQQYLRDIVHVRGLMAARVLLFQADIVTPMVLVALAGVDDHTNFVAPKHPGVEISVGDTLRHACIGVAASDVRLFVSLLALSSNIPHRRIEAMGAAMEKCRID